MQAAKKTKPPYAMLICSMLARGPIGIFRRWIQLDYALLAFFRVVIGAAALTGMALVFRRIHPDESLPAEQEGRAADAGHDVLLRYGDHAQKKHLS